MNIHGYEWTILYPDGRRITQDDATWRDISISRYYGTENLFVSEQSAVALNTSVNGRTYTLRAPDADTHFFRYYRSRIALTAGTEPEILYYAIGYVCAFAKVTMEIDAKGNTQMRIESLTTEMPEQFAA